MTTRQSIRFDDVQLNKASADNDISGDGKYVAYRTEDQFAIDNYDDDGGAAAAQQLYRTEVIQGGASNILLTRSGNKTDRGADGNSFDPAMSDDGSLIAFDSFGTNFFDALGNPIADGNGIQDVYIFEPDVGTAGAYTRIARGLIDPDGLSNDPAVSGNGKYVAFESDATNLTPPGTDVNGKRDIFVYMVDAPNTINRVSTINGTNANDPLGASNGKSRNPDLSDDGARIVFDSVATNLVAVDANGASDIFLREGTSTTRVSVPGKNSVNFGAEPDAASFDPAISGDGRYVAFESDATNLVDNDTNGFRDIFVYDTVTGDVERVSITTVSGAQANGNSFNPDISDDGRFVAFQSDANNLVPNDLNLERDVFVHDRQTGVTSLVSVDSSGVEGNRASEDPHLTDLGNLVAFESLAENLVANDTNAVADIFTSDEGLPGGGGSGGTPTPENPRIPGKADWNGNGSNDIVIQNLTDPSFPEGTLLFFDPAGISAHPGAFDTFVAGRIFAVPQWEVVAISNGVTPGSGSEVIIFSESAGSVPAQTLIFEPGNTIQFVNPGDANDQFAPLSTPGYTPVTAADVSGDGRDDIIYRGNDGTEFEGMNIYRDSLTRQFASLPPEAAMTTDDAPVTSDTLANGQERIIFGNPITGEYRAWNLSTNSFGDYFADDEQTAPLQLMTGATNFESDEDDVGVFQQQGGGTVSGYSPTAGEFDRVLFNTPGWISAS